MKPSNKPNNHAGNCLPVAGACVTWPENIELCAVEPCSNDKLPDIVAKLDHIVCEILKEIDFEDNDLKCLIPACASCPDPEKTLKSVILLLISKVCTLEQAVSNISGGPEQAEDMIRVASCFIRKDLDGENILSLSVDNYVKAIGAAFCDLKTQVEQNTQTLDDIDGRLTEIETEINADGAEIQVQLQCTFATNAPVSIKDALEAFEAKFCEIKTVLGTTNALSASIGKQCADGMGDKIIKSLSDPSTSIGGWDAKPETVADTLSNMWLAICDIRGAVKAMQDNCCAITCEDILVDFDIKLSDDRQTLTLFFAQKSMLPNGFTDVNALGNKLLITDSDGHQYTVYVKIVDAVTDLDGIQFDLSGSPLDPTLDWDFDMDANMTNGSMTCSKCIHKTATVKPELCNYCEITATGTNGDTSGYAVIIYETTTIN